MLNAFVTVQALHVAAGLGLADLLADAPKSAEDLAAATNADPASLHRLLRMLAGSGVFHQEVDGSYALTALGTTLKSDGPDSVREWALFVGAPEMWSVWGGLRESVVTGRAAFPAVHGVPIWEYIAAVLTANPSLRGVLLDLPAVVVTTAPLEAAGVSDRCEVIGDDMLRTVPAGGDAYIVKRVLMDWSDTDSTTILRNCREAMTDNGKVLVVEMLLPASNEPSPARAFDILMLLGQPGGRIRTEAEFRELFTGAGLRLSRVVSTASPNSILEGTRT